MSGADRQRRHRERRRRGVAVLPVEVGETTYWALGLAGMLTDAEMESSSAVGRALGKAISEWTTQKLCDALREDPREGSKA